MPTPHLQTLSNTHSLPRALLSHIICAHTVTHISASSLRSAVQFSSCIPKNKIVGGSRRVRVYTTPSPRRSSTMAAATSACQKLLAVGTKIIAVGRNYAAHAKELGNAVPKEPVLFMKPTTSYLEDGGRIEVPHNLESLDHEVELAVVIGRKARDIPEASAMDYVGGYALALDMTAREIQAAAKSAGLPWTVAKGQDTFTPISSVLPCTMIPDPHDVELWLKVDGDLRQKGSTRDMIFKIPYLISHISSIMTLLEGDVILTGTPQGVGPVKVGEKIEAGITGLLDIHFDVGRRKSGNS